MVRVRHLIACVVGVVCVFGAVSSARAQTPPKAGESFSSITTNGIWTWYGEPKAVYYEGVHKRTYMAWNSNNGIQYAGYYDHETNTTSQVALPRHYPNDDHNHPSLIVRPDGRVMIFHTGHDGREIAEYISKQPEDLSALDTFTVKIVDWCCYPNVCFLKNEGTQGRYYLFFRDSAQEPWFRTSDDWGKTWAVEKHLYTNKPQGYKPYFKCASNGIDEIHIDVERENRAGGGSIPTYYMKYKNGAFYQASGKLITTIDNLPIVNTVLDTVIYPGSYGCGGTVWDIGYDKNDNPIILYDLFKGDHIHIYWYLHWNGSSWDKHPLLNSGDNMGAQGQFAGGFTLDHENPNVIYLSHQMGVKAGTKPFTLSDPTPANYAKNLTTSSYVNTDSVFELSKWTTCDGGLTWDTVAITRNSTAKNTRPCVPRGHKDSQKINLIWLDGIYTSMGGTGFNMAVRMYPVSEPIPASPSCATPVGPQPVSGHQALLPVPQIRMSKTGLAFTLAKPSRSSLTLYSLSGSLIADFSNTVRHMSAGPATLSADRIPVTSGMVIAVFNDGEMVTKAHIILTK